MFGFDPNAQNNIDVNSLASNPLFMAGMGLLSAGRDRRIDPFQAASQGLLTANHIQSQQANTNMQNQLFGMKKTEFDQSQAQQKQTDAAQAQIKGLLQSGDQKAAAQVALGSGDKNLMEWGSKVLRPFDLGDVAKFDPASLSKYAQTNNYGDLVLADKTATPMSEYQRQELALRNKELGLKEQQNNPFGMNGASAANPSGVSGDEFLQTLPPQVGAQVKALAEGRMQFPGGFALKSPYWQQMISAVSQYDPNFDAVNYNARAKTRSDFTSGKNAQNIKSLNTAIGHLGTLNDQLSGTSSLDTPMIGQFLNKGINAYKEGSGDPGITNYNQTASALASELTQVFRGTGGAEADVKRYIEQMNPNASKEQKTAMIKNITDLLNSRINAIGDQYNQGMGTTADPLTLLNPKAAEVMKKINGGATAPTSFVYNPQTGKLEPK